MGAIQGIFAAQYDTLRAHGHTPPSEAFNETVEELTQSLMPLVAENGMDWMYANCSTTAQRGALDWWKRFRDATKPVFEELYGEVAAGNEAQRSIDLNSKTRLPRETQRRAARDARKRDVADRRRGVQTRPENNLIPGRPCNFSDCFALRRVVSAASGTACKSGLLESPAPAGPRRRRGGIPAAGHRQPAINSFVT